ncbi:4'-phosphopantetheinyl transferase family protein [Marivita hallyeonensis]|uniref:Enterobactin synthase component D n=1 Tax=Marivita hallyeonensis TaxID=996342 RepID=A0A1M5TUE6_9RHOB|nr:4'-phosphopantetheinyl transferase superfamily protein [Marivita hallyeonensis]SHH54354.1 4'-phosphopantetheinyl transferase EntD (siderophore biosynthesis) [Marivita hallyeonensis]
MTRRTQPDPIGFLTDVQTQRIGARTCLLTAVYHPDCYDPALFEAADLPMPPRIARSIRKRQMEFLSGRLLAQTAQAQLGLTPQPIDIAESRAPVWPDGVTGSLSHARGRCAAILSTDTTHHFGIDCEAVVDGSALTAIQTQTLTEADKAFVTTASEATCLFSAKEAVFKALHPQVGRFFGFDAAELAAPIGADSLTLRLTDDLNDGFRAGHLLEVHHQTLESHVLTWLRVPAR